MLLPFYLFQNGYFILFALSVYISVIQTFLFIWTRSCIIYSEKISIKCALCLLYRMAIVFYLHNIQYSSIFQTERRVLV